MMEDTSSIMIDNMNIGGKIQPDSNDTHFKTESSVPHLNGLGEKIKILEGVKKISEAKSKWSRCRFSWCSLTYFQKFFEVSTEEVFTRGKRALIPVCFTKPFYFPRPVDKPDLYGPFWICTTIVILLTAASNFTDWIYFKSSGMHPVWQANFSHLTFSASMFYSQISIIPLMVWGGIKYCGKKKSLVEIISLYGYSLTVFIPNVILCSIPLESVQWISISLTYLMSVSFLLRNISNGLFGGTSNEPASMMELAKIVRHDDTLDSWDGDDASSIDDFTDVDRTINGTTRRKTKPNKGKIRLVLLAILILQSAFCLIFKIHFFY